MANVSKLVAKPFLQSVLTNYADRHIQDCTKKQKQAGAKCMGCGYTTMVTHLHAAKICAGRVSKALLNLATILSILAL